MSRENNPNKSKNVSENSEYLRLLGEMRNKHDKSEEIRKYLWKKYAVEGMNVDMISRACDEVILVIMHKEKEDE